MDALTSHSGGDALSHSVQGDHSGRRIYFVDSDFNVPLPAKLLLGSCKCSRTGIALRIPGGTPK